MFVKNELMIGRHGRYATQHKTMKDNNLAATYYIPKL
jgi:hypothetical protein